ncbi:MAG: peroxiredoxin family protein [Blastocatellia bacterium]
MIRRLKMKIVLTVACLAFASIAVFGQSPSATLQTTDGKAVSLADLKGKVLVLSFGGTWVPLTSRELPALQKLADRVGSRGAQVYWVSINSAQPGARNYAADADLQAFAQKNGLRLPVLRDPEQKLYKQLALDGLPTLVILDQQGKVVRKHVGFGTEAGEAYNALTREIEQLLK